MLCSIGSSSSSLTVGRRCLSYTATCCKSLGKTGRGRGGTFLNERDQRRLTAKRERTFVALMHKKFGVESGNDVVGCSLNGSRVALLFVHCRHSSWNPDRPVVSGRWIRRNANSWASSLVRKSPKRWRKSRLSRDFE